jgi:hypothetical protein
MSRRLDLHSKEQKSRSHQAALVIWGIKLINTRIWATYKEAKRGDQREKMPRGTAATARAKGASTFVVVIVVLSFFVGTRG